jgi:hypothetical protein
MVWLYEDMRQEVPEYRDWLRCKVPRVRRFETTMAGIE